MNFFVSVVGQKTVVFRYCSRSEDSCVSLLKSVRRQWCFFIVDDQKTIVFHYCSRSEDRTQLCFIIAVGQKTEHSCVSLLQSIRKQKTVMFQYCSRSDESYVSFFSRSEDSCVSLL